MMSGFKPFQVTWELCAPVIVPSMPIHLDALLSWSRVQAALDDGNADALSLQHDIPLERHEADGGWCFKASIVEFDYIGDRQQLHFIKRSNIDEYAGEFERGTFGSRKPYFDASRGATKAASVQMHQAFASRASAYGVGDIEGVRELLASVASLGKLRRRGKGSVRFYEVTELAAADRLWTRRNLPMGSGQATGATHAPAQQRLYAPYWSKDRQEVFAPL